MFSRSWIALFAALQPLVLFDAMDRPPGHEFPTGSGIYVVRADGTGLRRLARDTEAFPSWSPDGTRVAYTQRVGCEECTDVYVAALDGSPRRRLTSDGHGGGAVWSPAGDVIALDRCLGEKGPCGIQAVAPDGTGARWLARGRASTPVWSPDGRRIAYERELGSLWVMAADGSGKRRLTRRGRRTDDSAPVWSPDGTQVAFDRHTLLGDRRARWDVYAIGADGSGLRRLTRGGTQNLGPAWSPDGHLIAFVGWRRLRSRECSQAAIEVVGPDGSGRRRITEYRAMYDEPEWSADGRQLAYASIRRCWASRSALYARDADGSDERRLSTDPEPDVSWSWQPGVR